MTDVIFSSYVQLSDVTDFSWPSYSFWTQSFFGHSGIVPAGTGNPLTERGEEAIKGEKGQKHFRVPQRKPIFTQQVT